MRLSKNRGLKGYGQTAKLLCFKRKSLKQQPKTGGLLQRAAVYGTQKTAARRQRKSRFPNTSAKRKQRSKTKKEKKAQASVAGCLQTPLALAKGQDSFEAVSRD